MTKKKDDMFGFDDQVPRASVLTDEIQAGDDRTLRLAAPLFTTGQLEQFVTYQQKLRDRLSTSPLHREQWDAWFAAGHQAALADCGLSAADHARISAVVAKFCAHLTTRRVLQQKQAELRIHLAGVEATGAEPSLDEREVERRLSSELARLQSLAPLERRYGAEAIALLQDWADQLLALHADIARRMATR